ncbi:nuclear transport factor 2 family protein [Nocardia farcinica]|uniref:nuclear transport factor 2 family protein n=1 Tax=Nocardia farcinica TaxID=37329 RepID=UPI002453A7D1|nr:nuclear transport factor 2 family protein [Nocardia farcinica]
MNDLVAQYLAIWNTTDPVARRAAIARVFTDRPAYVDPLMDLSGREAIDAGIAAVQSQFPGLVFRLAGPVDAHHEQARFRWELGPADGAAVVVGFDVAILDGGRIDRVYGFLDQVPAAA